MIQYRFIMILKVIVKMKMITVLKMLTITMKLKYIWISRKKLGTLKKIPASKKQKRMILLKNNLQCGGECLIKWKNINKRFFFLFESLNYYVEYESYKYWNKCFLLNFRFKAIFIGTIYFSIHAMFSRLLKKINFKMNLFS